MQVQLTWRDAAQAELRFPGRVVAADEISTVWYRRPVPPVLPPDLDPDRAQWSSIEAHEALQGFLRTLDARWVNDPVDEAAAVSKPEQLRRARQYGLTVPETLITNTPTEASLFASAGPTICKPMGEGVLRADGTERIFFTRLLSKEDVAALDTIGPEPYLLQRQVRKQFDLRVTVIGDDLIAVRIGSQVDEETEVDWRRGDANALDHEHVELPAETAASCLALVKSYGLKFAAVDFAIDRQGEYVFFEINPSGQWAWLEELAGVPLRARMADLLIGE